MNIKYYTRKQLEGLLELLNTFDVMMVCPSSQEFCSPKFCKHYYSCRTNIDNLGEICDLICELEDGNE